MSTILHVISAPASGGAEAFVSDLACSIAGRGHSLHVVFIDKAIDSGHDPDYENVFLSRLDKYGVSYSFLGHEVRRKPWLGISRLRTIVRKKGVDLIHSHLAYGNIFSVGALGVPMIYTHHSERVRFAWPFWLYFRLRASCFVGISEACSNNLRGYVGVKSKMELVRNGIDLSTVKSLSSKTLDDRGLVHAVCVGRVAECKNYPLLANAIASLDIKYRSRIVVDVFGEGTDDIIKTCQDILAKANVRNDAIRFLGVSSNIRGILSNYDVFLMTSSTEGLPIALIEASAVGLPIVATDVGGCRELIEFGPSGLVVPPNNVSAFRDALKTMIDSSSLRKEFTTNSQRTAEAYSIEHAVDQYLRIYNETIDI